MQITLVLTRSQCVFDQSKCVFEQCVSDCFCRLQPEQDYTPQPNLRQSDHVEPR